jgi:dolichyl-phosphate-mannose--protein O-mannosyl transferase
MQSRDGNKTLLPVLVIVASAASIVATVVLAFYGIYFFFFFIPIAFGLPWSIRKLWRGKARKQWSVEDLR